MTRRAASGGLGSAAGGILCLVVLAALTGVFAHGASSVAQPGASLLPVGVEYPSGGDTADRRRDLEEMRRLRFNAVRFGTGAEGSGARPLALIDRVLAGAPDPRVTLPPDRPAATIAVGPGMSGGEVSVASWSAVARGAGAIVFADWTTLLASPEGLAAASHFAEAIGRNAALYAPLRPVAETTDRRRVRLAGPPDGVEATLLESADALVLIALNRAMREERVTMTFSPDVPEAIWQNMLEGMAVNFVAGPDGPVYEHTFQPRGVLVFAIRTALR